MSRYPITAFLLCSIILFISSGLSEDVMKENYQEKDDFMFGDAVPVPTPAVCSEGITCGFLEYDDDTTGYHNHKYTHYCNCPGNLTCTREGTNMELRYYYFTCQNSTESEQPDTQTTSDNSTSVSVGVTTSGTTNEVPTTESSSQNLKRSGYMDGDL